MENLGDVYGNQTNFGKIKLTSNGIEIQGELLTNITEQPLRVIKFGKKTLVTCQFIADSFEEKSSEEKMK